MSRVKLKGISDKADLWLMTVPRIMNNAPKVGAKTRDKIAAIAKK